MTKDSGASNPREFGRYVILRELGRGAIGIVYAAYHEGLDRKLAIKVLNRSRAGRPDLEARLWREARALARLSHPNVVQVYDVNELEGRVYVVMEFVEGHTLSEWMKQTHPLDEVLEMFIAAGRGLAAAHAAGVVHRDFKPDNVIVGVDGRPRVLDFGLARPLESDPRPTDESEAELAREPSEEHDERDDEEAGTAMDQATQAGAAARASARELAASHDAGELAHDRHTDEGQAEPVEEFEVTVQGSPADAMVLTRTGARLGTPAYMSPEQFRAEPATHASDQFSFCVALHEAVYGRRPFPARNKKDLSLQVQAGRILDAPPDSTVPEWLRAVILRGLRPKPEERWPSMEALLDALAQPPEDRSRRRWTIGLALAGVAVVALVVGVLAPRRDKSCPSQQKVEAQLWSADEQQAAARAFTNSGSSYADAAWASVGPRLDDWVRIWAREQVDVCTAKLAADEVEADTGAVSVDRRAACLDRSRRAFLALRGQFLEADATLVEGAVEAVTALPDPSRCAKLLDEGAVPPEHAHEIEELRNSLAELDTRSATGRGESVLSAASTAVSHARAIGYAPVIAEALLTEARLLTRSSRSGAVDEALDKLEQALDLAEQSGAHELIPRVAIELVSLSIYAKPDPVRGRLWARRALAGLDRLSSDHAEDDALGLAKARGAWALGNLERIDGDNEAAQRHLREALALLDAHAPDHPERGVMLNDLGNVLAVRGDFEGARRAYERALQASLQTFGEGHPRVGNTHFNLARLAYDQGDLAGAREQADLAFVVFARARGSSHRDVGEVELLRAAIELGEGNFKAARERAIEAQTIYDAELAPDNITRAEPHEMLGHIAFASGDFDAAIVGYQDALAIKRAALPPGHIDLVSPLTNLGLVRFERAKLAAKRPLPNTAAVDREAAVELLEQALKLRETGEGVDPEKLRENRLYLADALLTRAEPGDVERAAELFELGWVGCRDDPQICAALAVGAARARARLGDEERAHAHVVEAHVWLDGLDRGDPQVEELHEHLRELGD